MRKFLLGSAALLLSTGMACAQTASPPPAPAPAATPSPAPDGSTSGPVETSPGMAPGKTTPPQAAQPPAAMSGQGSMAPATPPAPPAPLPAGSPPPPPPHAAMAAPKRPLPPHHPYHPHPMMMANGTPHGYLQMAKQALRNHNKAEADDALSHAETLMLTRSVPQDAGQVDHSPAVTAIENARKAVRDGDMSTANSQIDTAMDHMPGGMMHHPMHRPMHPGMMRGNMAPPPGAMAAPPPGAMAPGDNQMSPNGGPNGMGNGHPAP